MKPLVLVFLLSLSAFAEVRTLTLRQALDLALAQNPDVMIARLDQQRARQQVTIIKDAFQPKVYGGSGLAKGNGFPLSIENAAPAVFRTQTQMALFNRPLSFQVAQANEAVRGADVDVSARQDDIVYRVTGLFLDAERAARSLTSAERQVESLIRVQELTQTRVAEGRELSIESRRAALAVAKARQSTVDLTTNLIDAETMLAQALGLNGDDRVRPAAEEVTLPETINEERSIEEAIENSKDLKRLESNLQAKMLEIKQQKAERLPKINLVAQYAVLARYNNYDRFFNSFERNNWQFGASIDMPLLPGRGASAAASQAEIDASKIRLEVSRTRSRITSDLRRAHQEVRRAESARDLARADLDLAREQLTVFLAQYDEGRLPMARVEEARATEQEKWLAYYGAQYTAERARLEVLHQSGTLLAALR